MRKVLITIALMLLMATPALAFDLGGYVGPVSYHFTGWGVGREYTTNDQGATWTPENPSNNWFGTGDPQGLPNGVNAPTLTNNTYIADNGIESSWGIIRLDQALIQTGQLDGGTEVWSRPVSGSGEYIVGIFYGFNDIALINGSIVDHTGGTMDLYALNLSAVPDGTGLDPDARTATGAYPGFTGTGAELLARFSASQLNDDPSYNLVPDAVTRRDATTGGTSLFPATMAGTGVMLMDIVPGVGSGWQIFDGNGVYDNFGDLFIPGHDMLVEYTFQYSPGQGTNSLLRFDSAISDPARGTSNVIPEPTSMALLSLGLLGLARLRRKN